MDTSDESTAVPAVDHNEARLRQELGQARLVPFTVMLIADDESAHDLAAHALREEGCELLEAVDGRAALKTLETFLPDLVLLDLMMPEKDGFEFLEELRKKPVWRELPVVVLISKDTTREDRIRLNEKVSQMFVKGEFSREELARQLWKLLALGKR